MNIIKSKNNKRYLITNSNKNFTAQLSTSNPRSKKGKKLILQLGKDVLHLNGFQINTLKRIFEKENVINKS